MKKTVIFEFPDDFKFPEYFGQKNTVREVQEKGTITGTVHNVRTIPITTCLNCPFYISDDAGSWCMITGGEEAHHIKCPFYDGADSVNYDDC